VCGKPDMDPLSSRRAAYTSAFGTLHIRELRCTGAGAPPVQHEGCSFSHDEIVSIPDFELDRRATQSSLLGPDLISQLLADRLATARGLTCGGSVSMARVLRVAALVCQ